VSASRTVVEKVADWRTAYLAIKAELTPEAFRVLTDMASASDVQSINVGMVAARTVFANDRAAATVAALLTQSGIKISEADYGEGIE